MIQPPLTPGEWILLGGLAVACFIDVRSQRLPNALTFPLMGIALVLAAIQGTLGAAAIGLVSAFALHFVLWRMGIDKAGDAKLMMAIGAFLGWAEMIEATLLTFAIFFPAGLLLIVVRGRLHHLIAAVMWTMAKAQGQDPGERPPATYVAKAPFIALGTIFARFVDLM